MGKRFLFTFLALICLLLISIHDINYIDHTLDEKEEINPPRVETAKAANYVFLQSPENGSVLTSGTEIFLEIDDSLLLRVDFNWNFQANFSFLPPYITVLPPGDGLHVLHVYALDNLDIWEYQKFHFTTDDTPPIIQLESNTNTTIQAPNTPINLIINDTNLEGVTYHWNDDNNISLGFPFTVYLPFQDGNHILTVYAIDMAGNWGLERFLFTVQIEIAPDTDNDGLDDYIEFFLGTDPGESTDTLFGFPLVISDLEEDTPDDYYTVLVSHDHIVAQNWIIGMVDEKGFEDETDSYIFTSEIRTTGKVVFQSNVPGIQLTLFDLEGRINISTDLGLNSIQLGIGASDSSFLEYIPNALPYLVEIPIPLAVELFIIQIDGGFSGSSLYSIWVEHTPLQPHMELLSIIFNLILFIGFPFMFFLILRWENRRLTKRLQKIEQVDETELESSSDSSLPKKFPPIVKVRFSEWIFSSFVLFIMVLLFTELSREKFQNQVSVLTAKGFVDLGYRIFFLAVTLIIIGIVLSVINWVKNRISNQGSMHQRKGLISWVTGLTLRVLLISIVYVLLWIGFIELIILVKTNVSSLSSLYEILDLFEVFFAQDLSVPPSVEELTFLKSMGVLELIFIVFTIPLALYMFVLNFAGGTSIKKIFRASEERKSRWNYKTIILGLSLSIEIYRIFSNLVNFLISIFFSENSTFFFIQISELPWWHQLVTWISQETLISTPVLYGLYFELQGIFFAWVIYTSLPTFFRRFMAGSGFSKSITRIGFFLLGMFVIFLRTLHLLLLIPIGVPSFPFSVILTDPFSILLLVAMISESIEILGFILGMLFVFSLRTSRKDALKSDDSISQLISIEEPKTLIETETSIVYQIEEE